MPLQRLLLSSPSPLLSLLLSSFYLSLFLFSISLCFSLHLPGEGMLRITICVCSHTLKLVLFLRSDVLKGFGLQNTFSKWQKIPPKIWKDQWHKHYLGDFSICRRYDSFSQWCHITAGGRGIKEAKRRHSLREVMEVCLRVDGACCSYFVYIS